MSRIVFDIETEPFSQEFKDAETKANRRTYAPNPRLACAYIHQKHQYRFFQTKQMHDLIDLLQNCEEVISFNGRQFDFLVLEKYSGKRIQLKRGAKHTDMHEIMTKKSNFRVSLHLAVRVNFGEKKHTDGRKMTDLDMTALQTACKSDVNQTFRLWKKYRAGSLVFPKKSFRRTSRGEDAIFGIGPGMYMPFECPNCKMVGCLEFIEEDPDEMTEGQAVEYLAGTWGSYYCLDCNHFFDYEI